MSKININFHCSNRNRNQIQSLLWKTSLFLNPERPGWLGMMQFFHESNYPDKSSVVFLPVIDLELSDVSCIYLMLNFVCSHAAKYGVNHV